MTRRRNIDRSISIRQHRSDARYPAHGPMSTCLHLISTLLQDAQKFPCLRRSGYAQAGRCKLSLRNPACGGARGAFHLPARRQSSVEDAYMRLLWRTANKPAPCVTRTSDEGNAAHGCFSASCLVGRNRHNRSSPFFSGLHQGEDKHQE
jgi:hypothetical protein